MKHKYIIVDDASGKCPILFPTYLNHDHVGWKYRPVLVTSAGFVSITFNIQKFLPQNLDMNQWAEGYSASFTVFCSGESESLNIKSNPEEDAKVIKAFLLGEKPDGSSQ